MSGTLAASAGARVWAVGALCRAVADALDARFNPVEVRGELTGMTRAASGHLYFTLKDDTGQLRCAMFRRAAMLLNFNPQSGEKVVVCGRLGVYEPRGEMQLVVESMSRAGQGDLFETFLKVKARLESEGLFDPVRKRAIPLFPRGIGIVTSLGAAALHDVAITLQRRVPHVPVVLASASVQGAHAPSELVQALALLYARAQTNTPSDGRSPIDVILVVRGGGSMEDLWAFNDETLARTLAHSPVPVISGVGHETDFTIADFVSDLRAPTPTAAAELAAVPTSDWLVLLAQQGGRLNDVALRYLDRQDQRLDACAGRLGRPSGLVASQHMRLAEMDQHLQQGLRATVRAQAETLERQQLRLHFNTVQTLQAQQQRYQNYSMRLDAVNPAKVLHRGYAWLSDRAQRPVLRASSLRAGAQIRATMADGVIDLTVDIPSAI